MEGAACRTRTSPFEGEGSGFRRADTMIRVLESELHLYAHVFGLAPAGVPKLELHT